MRRNSSGRSLVLLQPNSASLDCDVGSGRAALRGPSFSFWALRARGTPHPQACRFSAPPLWARLAPPPRELEPWTSARLGAQARGGRHPCGQHPGSSRRRKRLPSARCRGLSGLFALLGKGVCGVGRKRMFVYRSAPVSSRVRTA